MDNPTMAVCSFMLGAVREYDRADGRLVALGLVQVKDERATKADDRRAAPQSHGVPL